MKRYVHHRLYVLYMLVLYMIIGSFYAHGQTLNPTADTDSQSDNSSGTNSTLNASKWCHMFLKFDISNISANVVQAKLRIYQVYGGNPYTLNVNTTTTDNWSEGTTLPDIGTLITSKSVSGSQGYIEIDVTSYVQSKMSGNKIVSFGITTNLDTWTSFYSRQNNTNKPELVLTVTNNSASANKTLSTIVIDGNPNESVWQFNYAVNKSIIGGSNNTVSYAVCWDNNYLYVAAKVLDGSLYHDSPNPWDDDAVEIYIDGNHNGGMSYDSYDRQFIQAYQSSTLWEQHNNTNGVQHAWSAINGGYAVELAIPWSNLGITPSAGLQIGFDVGNDDDDNGGSRDSQLMWAGNGDNWRYPQGFGTLTLSSQTIGSNSGDGLKGSYFNNKTLSGSPAITRVDSTINFNWGNGSYAQGQNTDLFSVRWTGQVLAPVTGSYTFSTVSDDGVRLWVNSSLLIDNWTDHPPTTNTSNPISLTAGQKYDIVLEYYENQGGAVVKLQWSYPGQSTQIIPQSQLFSNSGSQPPSTAVMTPGANFWNIGWEGWQDFFQSGVDWATTTNPWNPTLISELQQAKIKCLRFMDWNATNTSCVVNWSQRIPKTANHYNQDNLIPCFVDHYDPSTNTHNLEWNGTTSYGVAYEWQIDLCNRIGADYWINIPVAASDDYVRQLATLIKNQLNSNLKVYVEWGNEVWNWGFATTVYANQQAKALGLDTVDVGAYCDPWRKYDVYASSRVFKIFKDVFGVDSNRLVKVISGQVAYHWDGYDYNHMVVGDLAALRNVKINPYGITIDAYAMAPYMGGQSMTEEQNAISQDEQMMIWAKNSLDNTNIRLICYEAGADNYPDNNLTLTRDPQQEQLYVQYLTMLNRYVEGPVMQYCFYGGPWGLKNHPGEGVSLASKWRGWIDFWGRSQW
ncbi:PA14 domain-containing protein [Thermoflavifilum thermophilum]|uniref:Carbohydrate family 9 binding domain-like n=1 Tax=Thermoflavifilum thermophilum TaxID=1393122 RepID=A0A1I7MX83_9BACT|nr:PA14 domain-containing protein [Thermoflavifilum thermophilum]SFV27039.1 Carbohydrate family 9 binding domain-like [Thermoflavifilum thermophilum]